MKVIFEDGTIKKLSKHLSKNLSIYGRFDNEDFKVLLNEMKRLKIAKFQDPILCKNNFSMVSIEYVALLINKL